MMTKKETGEFLYRYYRKRIASFLASLYKASITCDDKDIHKARVDMKKIFALFHLFEMVLSDRFIVENHYPLLKNIFIHSGRIREIQINLDLLEHYGFDLPDMPQFKEYLVYEEVRLTRIFLSEIKKFDEKKLNQADKEIKKIVVGISQKKFLTDALKFIDNKTGKISKLLGKEYNPETVHKIRRHLKSMSAIATMSLTLKEDAILKQRIEIMNRAEILIGEWHDKVVLLDTISKFRSLRIKKKKLKEDNPLPLSEFEKLVQEKCSLLLQQIKPAVDRVINEEPQGLSQTETSGSPD
ncbi:MAG: CHAD domain-containing protein [Bacteroidales bacterium]|jgi:CHAD domain-containing protein|nr:CHAD domain-containing protein [Bacteroidales bacterium]